MHWTKPCGYIHKYKWNIVDTCLDKGLWLQYTWYMNTHAWKRTWIKIIINEIYVIFQLASKKATNIGLWI